MALFPQNPNPHGSPITFNWAAFFEREATNYPRIVDCHVRIVVDFSSAQIVSCTPDPNDIGNNRQFTVNAQVGLLGPTAGGNYTFRPRGLFRRCDMPNQSLIEYRLNNQNRNYPVGGSITIIFTTNERRLRRGTEIFTTDVWGWFAAQKKLRIFPTGDKLFRTVSCTMTK